MAILISQWLFLLTGWLLPKKLYQANTVEFSRMRYGLVGISVGIYLGYLITKIF